MQIVYSAVVNYRSCKRSSASGNPLIIQPSNWSDLEHVVSWLHPGARMQLRWRNRFYALAKRLDMAGTEYITEKGPDNASLTYTAAKRGIRITMVVAWECILPHQITSIFASVAWGRGPIPVEPDESEVPFVLPRKPLAASRRFEASGAPQRLGQVPAELGPTLDEGWCSFQTTLYRSEDFTLVRQRYGVWSGKRGPLMARFFQRRG